MRLMKYINEDFSKEFSIEDNKEIEIITSKIKKECTSFIKSTTKHLKLFRGDISLGDQVYLLKTNKRRLPKDTDINVHRIVNSAFIDTFGIPLRSKSIFCTGDYTVAEEYGYTYCMIPVGNFEFYWSPKIADLYVIGEYSSELLRTSKDLWSSMFMIYMLSDNMSHVSYDSIVHTLTKFKSQLEDLMKLKLNLNLDDMYSIDLLKKQKIISQFFKQYKQKCAIEWVKKYYQKGNIQDAIKSEHEIMCVCNSYYMIYTNGKNFDIWNKLW